MFNRLLAALLILLALAGCARPAEVKPALWLVEGSRGEKGWLFGTIHALPEPVNWRSAKVDAALKEAHRLVLEVADIDNPAATAKAFAALAQSPGLPPLDQRVKPDLRDELAEGLEERGLGPGALDSYETWSAAIMLQEAGSNGIDGELARAWHGPIDEFEGAPAQLAIFDRLPEAQQRALLDGMLRSSNESDAKLKQLQQAWMRGDIEQIGRITEEDLNRDPALREALLAGRNRAWLDKLEAMLGGGAHPFVAVGAAHLAGKDGLPAMLAARGYKVTRLQ